MPKGEKHENARYARHPAAAAAETPTGEGSTGNQHGNEIKQITARLENIDTAILRLRWESAIMYLLPVRRLELHTAIIRTNLVHIISNQQKGIINPQDQEYIANIEDTLRRLEADIDVAAHALHALQNPPFVSDEEADDQQNAEQGIDRRRLETDIDVAAHALQDSPFASDEEADGTQNAEQAINRIGPTRPIPRTAHYRRLIMLATLDAMHRIHQEQERVLDAIARVDHALNLMRSINVCTRLQEDMMALAEAIRQAKHCIQRHAGITALRLGLYQMRVLENDLANLAAAVEALLRYSWEGHPQPEVPHAVGLPGTYSKAVCARIRSTAYNAVQPLHQVALYARNIALEMHAAHEQEQAHNATLESAGNIRAEMEAKILVLEQELRNIFRIIHQEQVDDNYAQAVESLITYLMQQYLELIGIIRDYNNGPEPVQAQPSAAAAAEAPNPSPEPDNIPMNIEEFGNNEELGGNHTLIGCNACEAPQNEDE